MRSTTGDPPAASSASPANVRQRTQRAVSPSTALRPPVSGWIRHCVTPRPESRDGSLTFAPPTRRTVSPGRASTSTSGVVSAETSTRTVPAARPQVVPG